MRVNVSHSTHLFAYCIGLYKTSLVGYYVKSVTVNIARFKKDNYAYGNVDEHA